MNYSNIEYFGKYLLLKKIASGGMAEVYLAKKPGYEGITKLLAIKKILPQYSNDPKFRSMFKNEANIAINLLHKNIVTIHEFGTERGQLYISMDFIAGLSLRQLTKRLAKMGDKLDLIFTIFVIKEICEGLDSAHRLVDAKTGRPLKILHRDVSPQNVLISYEGEIKIIDFGIAKSKIFQGENTSTGVLKGKFGYLSPEQVSGESIDSRTDIFSLGVIFWELLTGQRLFLSNNEINTIKKIMKCDVPKISLISPEVPEQVEKICLKALEKSKSDRFQTAGEMAKHLNIYLNKNHPEFSSRSFSHFIKMTYEKEIEKNRKELMESLNVEPPKKKNQGHDDDKSDSFLFSTTKIDPKTVGVKTDTGIKGVKSEKSQKTKVKKQDSEDVILLEDSLESFKSNEKTMKKSNPMRRGNPWGDTQSSYTNSTTNTGTQISQDLGEDKHSSLIISTLTVLFILGGGFLIFKDNIGVDQVKTFLSFLVGKKLTAEKVAPPPTPQVSKRDVSSVKPVLRKRIVLFESHPSGARLFVNGEDLNLFTPHELELNAYDEYEVRVVKDSFEEHTSSFVPANLKNQKFSVKLKKISLGYLHLDLTPHDAEGMVFVNGEVQSLPLDKHPVPALQDTSIVVTTTDCGNHQIVVKLKQNQKEIVHLHCDKDTGRLERK